MTEQVRFWEQGTQRGQWLRRHKWLRRLRLGALVVGLAAMVLLGYVGTARGWHQRAWDIIGNGFVHTVQRMGIYVKRIEVSHLTHLDERVLREQLAISRYENILSLDLPAARARAEALGWVKDAAVMRIWPSTIRVEIRERVPIARWYDGRDIVLIDADGQVIGKDDRKAFGDLLIVSGGNALARNAEIRALLDALPRLRARVSVAHLLGDRRWDLLLDNDQKIMLPEAVLAGDLARLQVLYDRYGLWDLPHATIDMRIRSRVVLRQQGTGQDLVGAPVPARAARPGV